MDILIGLLIFTTFAYVSNAMISDIVIDTQRSWIEANRFCKAQYGGQVISGDEVQNVKVNISGLDSFWTRDFGVLTDWISITGCYLESSIDAEDIVQSAIFTDNVIGRCARLCFNNSTEYFALQNTTCHCLSGVPNSKVDPKICDLSCDGSNEQNLCGGLTHYTVFIKATQTHNESNICAAGEIRCNCLAVHCLSRYQLEYYSDNCSTALAASCDQGGFRYIDNGRTVLDSWSKMLALCISGMVNRAPSSYLDNLEDNGARNVHCNGNPDNPNSVWTSIFRRYLPLTDHDDVDEDEDKIVCSYCIQTQNIQMCQKYHIGKAFCLDSGSGLKFICRYIPGLGSLRSTRTKNSSEQSSSTQPALTPMTSVEGSPELLMTKAPQIKDMTLLVAASSGTVVVIICVCLVILIFVYRRRKLDFQRKGEMDHQEKREPGDGGCHIFSSKKKEMDGKNNQLMFANGNEPNTKCSSLGTYSSASGPKDGINIAYSTSYDLVRPSSHIQEANNEKNTRVNIPHVRNSDDIHLYDRSGDVGKPCAEDSSNYDHLQLKKKSRDGIICNNGALYDSTETGNDVYDHTIQTKSEEVISSEYYDHADLHGDQASLYDKTGSMSTKLQKREHILSDENVYD